MELVQILEDRIKEELEGTAHFFVGSTTSKSGKSIKFFLDGDIGIPIEECSRISKILSGMIDEGELGGDTPFRYEISSPGTDMPLALPRQYAKHIGRKLGIQLMNGESFEGILKECKVDGESNENWIVVEKILETKKKGPAKTEITTLKMEDLKETKVIISFK